MISRIRILIILFFLLTTNNIVAQVYPDAKVDSLLKEGIRYIVMQQYDKAESLFKQLSQHESNIPFTKIYTTAVEIVKAYDYGIPFNDSAITGNLEKAVNICEELLDTNDENIWYNYFAAVAYAYSAYYEALQQNWLSAFTEGIESIEYFDRCIELDPSFYEAYVASSSYTYWKARKTESVNWLPFFDDGREEAITQLEKAVDYSAYNTFLAVNSLLWIYIDRGEAEKVIDITSKMLKEYEGSRFFMYPLARAYEDIDYAKANEVYLKIIHSYEMEQITSKVRYVELYHKVAQNYQRMDDCENALKMCNKILEMRPFTEFELEHINERIFRVLELKKECEEELD